MRCNSIMHIALFTMQMDEIISFYTEKLEDRLHILQH